MIARLRGLLDAVETDSLVVDVGGVGYLVFASARTLRELPAVGSEVTLSIETQVREDAISLFGFAGEAERDWFRILLTVQGVGSRVALSLLSTLSPDQLATAIAAQDRTALSRAPGVGPKLAARLLTELKDRAAQWGAVPRVRVGGDAPAASVPPAGSISEDAVSALVNLGYRRAEAYGAVARASGRLGAEVRLDALIRAGLQELSR
jgi:Holliday junction DNA helicase RuvA